MNLTVSEQLKKEPNLWINKALTVIFIIGIMIWEEILLLLTELKKMV